MTCYHPIHMFQLARKNSRGNNSIVSFSHPEAFRPGAGKGIKLPCGRCHGCRLERARQWAVRCMCELKYWRRNCFVTLTYADDALTFGGADHGILVPRDLTLFWKRLRKSGVRFRYFGCGEYGDLNNRPHYHAIIFGYDFPDKQYKTTKNGSHYFTSPSLNRIWGHGDCLIGDATFESASYVARYVMKKRLGDTADTYAEDGITPEFVVMSRRPGIGSAFYDEFENDMFPRDALHTRGHSSTPPRYFTERYRLRSKSLLVPHIHPMDVEDMISRRVERADRKWEDNEPRRLRVREHIKRSATKNLRRSL